MHTKPFSENLISLVNDTLKEKLNSVLEFVKITFWLLQSADV